MSTDSKLIKVRENRMEPSRMDGTEKQDKRQTKLYKKKSNTTTENVKDEHHGPNL